MDVIERPGVDPKWVRSWKTDSKRSAKWSLSTEPDISAELESYVLRGKTLVDRRDKGRAQVTPPWHSWDGTLETTLIVYALLRLREFEAQAVDASMLDRTKGMAAFAAAYTSQMILLQQHHLSFERIGKRMHCMSIRDLMFTALGIVLGAKNEGITLARLQLDRYRLGGYTSKLTFPIMHFILRLLNDYLEEPELPLMGATLSDPVFTMLLENWRAPDPQLLGLACLAALDQHTWQAEPGSGGEFDQGHWTRIPAELLLMFKLRQMLGLALPIVDHPLMNTAFAVLPEEIPFQPDEVISRVRARMVADGYDEDRIFAECYQGKQ